MWLISVCGVLAALWFAMEAIAEERRYGKMFVLLAIALYIANSGGLFI